MSRPSLPSPTLEFFRDSLLLAKFRWILVVAGGGLVALFNATLWVPANPGPVFLVLGGFVLENALLTLLSRRGLAGTDSRLDRLVLEWQALADQFLLGALILVTGGIQSPVVFVTFASLVATAMTVPRLGRAYVHGLFAVAVVAGASWLVEMGWGVPRAAALAKGEVLERLAIYALAVVMVLQAGTVLYRMARERQRRALLLLASGQTFSSHATREEILTTGLANLMRASRTGAAVVWLFQRQAGKSSSPPARGYSLREGGPLREAFEGTAGSMELPELDSRAAAIELPPSLARALDQPVGAMALGLRLVGPNGVLGGVLLVGEDRQLFFTGEIATCETLASQLAIALQNAQLQADLQQRVAELQRTQAQLVQSAKLAALGELVANIAHEFNNPLTSIVGYASELRLSLPDGDPRRDEVMIIEGEALRARKIVRDLLDFSRQRAPALEPVHINPLLSRLVSILRHQAQVANVEVEEEYGVDLPAVLADADQLRQVFMNLVMNGLDAMPDGGRLRITTGLSEQDGEYWVEVAVRDTGSGIAPELLSRVFEPFFTTKPEAKGMGLGLSVSQGIVESHKGQILVESEVGRGSTFRVRLPTMARLGRNP
jgi:signal transduction histidine kinase